MSDQASPDSARKGVRSTAHRIANRFAPLSRVMRAPPRERSRAESRRDLALAITYGVTSHALFGLAVGAMIAAMWFGMSASLGPLSAPWSYLANAVLLLQFPIVHSLLLTGAGRPFLARLAPGDTGGTLSTTSFAIVASVQLLLLFVLWSPSGEVWWHADGWTLVVIGTFYACAWILLAKASWDAGAEVQSGLLGWTSLLRGVRPPYPPMPTEGLFRHVRQPIYVSFALTTWCVQVWTPDQLAVAVTLTGYCMVGPRLKERRFSRLFGEEWRAYRSRTPYWIPRPRSRE